MAFQPHDVVPDSPINNFATLNPLNNASVLTLGDGNLKVTGTSNAHTRTNSSISISNGKFYVEVFLQTAHSYTTFGIGQNNIIDQYPGRDALSYAYTLENAKTVNNNIQPSYGSALSSGDIFKMFIDLDNYKLFFGKNTTWFNSSDPETGSLPAFSIAKGLYSIIARPYNNTAIIYVNFGQDHTFGGTKTGGGAYTDANGIGQFYYEPPEGALSLCTANIPSGPIDVANDDVPSDYMKALIWSGNGSNGRKITVGFQPDLVWIKSRNIANSPQLWDGVRGFGGGKALMPNNTNKEGDYDAKYGYINNVTANDFTLNSGTSGSQYVNDSSTTYVAWCWKAAGAPADGQAKIINEDGSDGTMSTADLKTNTGASITPSKVSANRKSGFSIIKYKGNGSSSGASIPHGLSAADFVIIKNTTTATLSTTYWQVFHKSAGNGYLTLNSTAAYNGTGNRWKNLSPDNQKIYLGGDNSYLNVENNVEYICYAWHSVAGYSKFGSFESTSSGVFVYLGFRPALIISKYADGTGHWSMYDNERQPFNTGASNVLYPDLSNAEGSNSTIYNFEFLSNGFRSFGTGSTYSSGTHLFMAFAESPFNAPSNAR